MIRSRGRGGRDGAPAGVVTAALVVVLVVVPLASAAPPASVPPASGPSASVPSASVTSAGAVSVGPRPAMVGPVPGPLSVVTPFDPPARRWLPGHRGVDLAAEPYSPVLSPADGTVSFAGAVAGRPVVSIDHGGGLRTTYEPVAAEVRAGDVVAAGARIGRLLAGHPGCPVVACLHWGARVASGGPSGDDDDYVDPLALLAATHRPIRLKPTLPGDGVG
ncbi:murein hydrolase activator EnvC family protein [Dietzia cinnamea]|uniref:murein hydrolase activator EnvC family protein n=1 Tax=Dietzia cinnamea TaxID=321318 RepID=UPI000D609916|nr:M23 family metallopeptidase [Dietzia cinnamea]MBM7229904.1 M23 family metallopeptidase [Dietzia cinnamea]PWD95115.1 peptidase M23 [Dietzia maris]